MLPSCLAYKCFQSITWQIAPSCFWTFTHFWMTTLSNNTCTSYVSLNTTTTKGTFGKPFAYKPNLLKAISSCSQISGQSTFLLAQLQYVSLGNVSHLPFQKEISSIMQSKETNLSVITQNSPRKGKEKPQKTNTTMIGEIHLFINHTTMAQVPVKYWKLHHTDKIKLRLNKKLKKKLLTCKETTKDSRSDYFTLLA